MLSQNGNFALVARCRTVGYPRSRFPAMSPCAGLTWAKHCVQCGIRLTEPIQYSALDRAFQAVYRQYKIAVNSVPYVPVFFVARQ
jgi:hypothetical protein